ncbi:MAG: hypothetical protein WCA77_04435 [Thermoplasmata archaeon]
MTGREPAWRVVARELTSSTEEEKGTGDRAATYLITPLGARANRVLLVGTLGAAERVGRDEAMPFYRAPLSDPTGQIPVTAGSFQPRALNTLRSLEGPRPALVVGKSHLYRGRDGLAYPSIRAEAIRALDPEEHQALALDVLDQVTRRFDLMRRVGRAAARGEPEPVLPGVPEEWLNGVRLARARYPSFDVESLRPSLTAYLGELLHPGDVPSRGVTSSPGSVTITHSPPTPSRAPASEAERAQESVFLGLIDELSEGSLDGYADLKDVVQLATSRGLSEAMSEALLNRLEEGGAVEEPIVGKLRRA